MRNIRVAPVADRVPTSSRPAPRATDRFDRMRDLMATTVALIVAVGLLVPILAASAAPAPGAALSASPTSFTAGASVTVKGTGLPVHIQGSIAWDDATTRLATMTTTGAGRTRVVVVVPAAVAGAHRLLAVDAAGSVLAAVSVAVATPARSAPIVQTAESVASATTTESPSATASPTPIATPGPTVAVTSPAPSATPTAGSADSTTPTPGTTASSAPTATSAGAPSAAPSASSRPTPAPSSSSATTTIPAGTAMVCGSRLSIVGAGATLQLPFCTNRSLSNTDATIRRAVIVVHGDSRNAPDHFRYIQRAASAAGVSDVVIVAPQFMTATDVTDAGLPASSLYWSTSGWKQGDGSASSPLDRPWSISSFAVMDRLVSALSNRTRFPNLREIVVVGHSAGGQLADRYAATSRIEPAMAALGVDLRFVVANPSSYLYLDDRRIQSGTLASLTPDQLAGCSNANSYKYGLDRLNSYAAATGANAIRDGFGRRTITYLLGALDTSRADASLDTSCSADLQGTQRYERGTRFFTYLQVAYGSTILSRQELRTVADVGHDASAIYNSVSGRSVVFSAP